jgi:hypothetical protein
MAQVTAITTAKKNRHAKTMPTIAPGLGLSPITGEAKSENCATVGVCDAADNDEDGDEDGVEAAVNLAAV